MPKKYQHSNAESKALTLLSQEYREEYREIYSTKEGTPQQKANKSKRTLKFRHINRYNELFKMCLAAIMSREAGVSDPPKLEAGKTDISSLKDF